MKKHLGLCIIALIMMVTFCGRADATCSFGAVNDITHEYCSFDENDYIGIGWRSFAGEAPREKEFERLIAEGKYTKASGSRTKIEEIIIISIILSCFLGKAAIAIFRRSGLSERSLSMLKNSKIALEGHVVLSVFSFIVLKELMYTEKMGLAVAVGLLISLGYVFIGYKFINSKKGYMAVLSVIAVGLVMWGICYTNTKYVDEHFDRLLFIPYNIYTFPFKLLTLPIGKLLETMAYGRQTIDIINMYLTLIPSALFWLGIFLKQRKLQKNEQIQDCL